MRLWRNNKKKEKELEQTAGKADVLNGLNLCCTYFERNIQSNSTFEPEFKASRIINSILQTKQILTESDVSDIVKLINDMKKVEHYDGSGWLDYRMRLGHFLRLSGFDVNLFD